MSIIKTIAVLILLVCSAVGYYIYTNKDEVKCVINVLQHRPTMYNIDFDSGGIILTTNSMFTNCCWHEVGDRGKSYLDLWKDAVNKKAKFYEFKR